MSKLCAKGASAEVVSVTGKVVVVGDGSCGKTSLLFAHMTGRFDESYTPTVFENYCSTIQVKG